MEELMMAIDKFYINQEIDVEFNISKDNTCWCGKDFHKNKHKLVIENDYIKLLKYGNSHNCKIKNICYPLLNSFNICKYYVLLNNIIHVRSGEYAYWNGIRWITISPDTPIQYKTLLLTKVDNFRNKDKNLLEDRITPSIAKNHILPILGESVELPYQDQYLFQFNNGLYDILNEKFITGEESKKYIYI